MTKREEGFFGSGRARDEGIEEGNVGFMGGGLKQAALQQNWYC